MRLILGVIEVRGLSSEYLGQTADDPPSGGASRSHRHLTNQMQHGRLCWLWLEQGAPTDLLFDHEADLSGSSSRHSG